MILGKIFFVTSSLLWNNHPIPWFKSAHLSPTSSIAGCKMSAPVILVGNSKWDWRLPTFSGRDNPVSGAFSFGRNCSVGPANLKEAHSQFMSTPFRHLVQVPVMLRSYVMKLFEHCLVDPRERPITLKQLAAWGLLAAVRGDYFKGEVSSCPKWNGEPQIFKDMGKSLI